MLGEDDVAEQRALVHEQTRGEDEGYLLVGFHEHIAVGVGHEAVRADGEQHIDVIVDKVFRWVDDGAHSRGEYGETRQGCKLLAGHVVEGDGETFVVLLQVRRQLLG